MQNDRWAKKTSEWRPRELKTLQEGQRRDREMILTVTREAICSEEKYFVNDMEVACLQWHDEPYRMMMTKNNEPFFVFSSKYFCGVET